MGLFSRTPEMPSAKDALPGRDDTMPVVARHTVTGGPMKPPFPDGTEVAVFGLGCFWGAERKFWQADSPAGGVPRRGVVSTMVGYAGGTTKNPTYKEVCGGRTGHTEVVQVVFDPKVIAYKDLLTLFWENHDPTQGMRQGNDVGTQYRSAIYATTPAQKAEAEASRDAFQRALTAAGHGTITTEIEDAPVFYYAEDYHQQYLDKNPDGYCGLAGTGVSCPIGVAVAAP
jgi:peptide-methionine (S)-S-oxide reductase